MGQEGQPLQGVGSLTLQKGNLSEKARLRGLQKGPAQGEVLQTGGEGGVIHFQMSSQLCDILWCLHAPVFMM